LFKLLFDGILWMTDKRDAMSTKTKVAVAAPLVLKRTSLLRFSLRERDSGWLPRWNNPRGASVMLML